MKLSSIVLLSASALLLPLSVNAAWPAGEKAVYMDQCIQVATDQGLDVRTANKHCKCGADAIEKNFTTSEIKILNSQNGVDSQLLMRAQAVVGTACKVQ